MRKFLFLLCIVSMLFCCSCGLYTPPYECEVENIASIQIIRLGKFVQWRNKYDYHILSEISDCETFVSRLNELYYSVNGGDPESLNTEDVVIKIDYSNGDFDLINWYAQSFYRSGVYQTGYYYFDDDQFNDLIEEYLSENNSV